MRGLVVLNLLACCLLQACGGGSPSTSTTTAASTDPVITAQLSALSVFATAAGVNVGAGNSQVACATANAVSVRDAGAVPDDGADDAPAIRAAIAQAGGGGTVLFPPGIYHLASTITTRSDLTLCAASTATLKWIGGRADMVSAPEFARVDRLNVYNLTFEGATVSLRGAFNRVVHNVFQHVNPVPGQDANDYSRHQALLMLGVTDSLVQDNVFTDVDQGPSVMGYDIARIDLVNNSFSSVLEPVHLMGATNTLIARNHMVGVARMGIEIQGGDLTGVVVEDNRVAAFRVRSDVSSVIALSVVSGQGTVIQRNVLICGDACVGATSGWGMEVGASDGAGSMIVSLNMVQGFSVGIGVGFLNGVTVSGNVVYDSLIGITKFNNGWVGTGMLVSDNQIENARDCGICGDWSLVMAPVLSGNIVSRKPGAWEGDSTRHYIGILGGHVPLGSAPMQISDNVVLLEGAAVSGFVPSGFCLCSANNLLGGMTMSGNTVLVQGPSAMGVGILVNSVNAAGGVSMVNNRFQGLSEAIGGLSANAAGSYTARDNQAFNMSANGIWSGFASSSQVTWSTEAVARSVSGGAASGRVVFAAAGSEGLSPAQWYLGDGARQNGASGSHRFVMNTDSPLLLRLRSTHTSGAVRIDSAWASATH
jgi:hypothetical protein